MNYGEDCGEGVSNLVYGERKRNVVYVWLYELTYLVFLLVCVRECVRDGRSYM